MIQAEAIKEREAVLLGHIKKIHTEVDGGWKKLFLMKAITELFNCLEQGMEPDEEFPLDRNSFSSIIGFFGEALGETEEALNNIFKAASEIRSALD